MSEQKPPLTVLDIVKVFSQLNETYSREELLAMTGELLNLANVGISATAARLEARRALIEEVLSITKSLEVAIRKVDRLTDRLLEGKE